MTHKEAFLKITNFINDAVLINLKSNEHEMAYQKHLLLSFANSLEHQDKNYKRNIQILISMIERTVQVNMDHKDYIQADQINLIYELARGLQNLVHDTPNDLDITLLN